MVDLLYILIIISFFGLMVLFVKWCEHIIGRDDAVDLPYDGIEDDDTAGAHTQDAAVSTHEEVPA